MGTKTKDRWVKMQRASVRSRINGRLSQKQALQIWRDGTLTRKKALAQMPGWTQRTAYRLLGDRNGVG